MCKFFDIIRSKVFILLLETLLDVTAARYFLPDDKAKISVVGAFINAQPASLKKRPYFECMEIV